MAGEEALNKISDFYDYSVWKCVPCSWLIHVQVCVDGETTIERWCCVQGSSDVSERGLRMHSTLDEYETTMNQMLMLPKACALIFVDGKKQNPHFVRTDGSSFTNPSTDDLIFLLTAMIPVAEFICHYSELGSVDGISASDIFSQASVASNNFPGEQVVKTMSFWEDKAVVVKMNASPNHNPFKHSMSGGATSRVSRDKELKTKCTVCEKTDEGMLQCVRCKSASYCSKECQRLDWPRHKKIALIIELSPNHQNHAISLLTKMVKSLNSACTPYKAIQ